MSFAHTMLGHHYRHLLFEKGYIFQVVNSTGNSSHVLIILLKVLNVNF